MDRSTILIDISHGLYRQLGMYMLKWVDSIK